jgi:hypothetical protein
MSRKFVQPGLRPGIPLMAERRGNNEGSLYRVGDHWGAAVTMRRGKRRRRLLTSQADARAVLRTDPSDPDGLDCDVDGISCESNRAPKDLAPVPR